MPGPIVIDPWTSTGLWFFIILSILLLALYELHRRGLSRMAQELNQDSSWLED